VAQHVFDPNVFAADLNRLDLGLRSLARATHDYIIKNSDSLAYQTPSARAKGGDGKTIFRSAHLGRQWLVINTADRGRHLRLEFQDNKDLVGGEWIQPGAQWPVNRQKWLTLPIPLPVGAYEALVAYIDRILSSQN
jgi:hypothetical protein